MSFGKPRPVTLTESCFLAPDTTCAAARMPTVVGATMTLRFGYLVSRALACVVLVVASSSPYTVSTSLRFAYFGSVARVVFISSIHSFWLVAVAGAGRVAMAPGAGGAGSEAQA